MVDRDELIWAAGFFDAEGSTYLSRSDAAIQIGIGQSTDPWVLHRFHRAVNAGRIYGPYDEREGHWEPKWYFKATGISTVQYILGQLWPFLSPVKRAQAIESAQRWAEAPRNRFVFQRIRHG